MRDMLSEELLKQHLI